MDRLFSGSRKSRCPLGFRDHGWALSVWEFETGARTIGKSLSRIYVSGNNILQSSSWDFDHVTVHFNRKVGHICRLNLFAA